MISLKVLSTAAVMALVLPMTAPTASFAQNPGVGRGTAGGGVRAGGGGGAPGAHFNGGGRGGGDWHGGYGERHHRDGGFIPGAVAGAVIGGAIASQSYGYYGGNDYYNSGYYTPGYYDDQYYDGGAVAVAPAPVGDDAVAYCMQTYQSYDPASGTYLGYDGYRHPCP
jgi:hypothetical protein